MKKINRTDLLIFIVSAELVGAVSALLSGEFGSFYAELVKSPFSPPGWVFPVVWAVLYAIMGISAYMVYSSESNSRKTALGVYIAQLAVNFSWSIIFFRFKLLNAAAVTAVILAVLVGIMIYCFARIRKSAGLINIPYLLWSIYASYLAIGTAFLN